MRMQENPFKVKAYGRFFDQKSVSNDQVNVNICIDEVFEHRMHQILLPLPLPQSAAIGSLIHAMGFECESNRRHQTLQNSAPQLIKTSISCRSAQPNYPHQHKQFGRERKEVDAVFI